MNAMLGDSPQIFISHATADRATVEWVADQVEAMGIRVYLAEDDPQPGAVLATKVKDAIGGSDALLVLLTQTALASRYVQQEIGAAVQAGIPILPLVDSSLASTSLAMLDGVEQLRFDPDNPAASSADLIVVLRHLSERRGAPEPQPVVVSVKPVLQLQLTAQLQLTGSQLLLGLLLLAAVAGVWLLVTRPATIGGLGAASLS